jgi:hypothetical protein
MTALLGAQRGVYCGPLRLLALEAYDRLNAVSQARRWRVPVINSCMPEQALASDWSMQLCSGCHLIVVQDWLRCISCLGSHACKLKATTDSSFHYNLSTHLVHFCVPPVTLDRLG